MNQSTTQRLLVIVAIMVAAGGVAARAGELAAAPSPGSAVVVGDSAGRLAEIVMHFDAEFATELAPAVDSLLSALPLDVRCLVLCPTAASASEFERSWGQDERLRGRDIHVVNVDRPITIWARDRRIARVHAESGLPAGLLVPYEWSEYKEDQRNDLFVNYLLERRGLVAEVESSLLHFEGGDLVSNNRHVFVGVDVLQENEKLGRERSETKRGLLEALGRDLVIIGEISGCVPWEHVDMYVTPVGDDTLLVASPTVALMLLSGDPCVTIESDSATDPILFVCDLMDRYDEFDAVADQLATYDYAIIRLPALSQATEWMITYNNVLMEERDGIRVVYMPVYGMARLDRAAEAVYRSLGFEVRRIDVSGIYQSGGALRCMVNVLRRDIGTVEAPRATGVHGEADAIGLEADNTEPPMPTLGSGDAEPISLVEPTLASSAAETASQRSSFVTALPPVAVLWLPVLIFAARLCDVSLGVFRLISLMRGHLVLATSLAALEVTIWILAVASVLTHLDNWINVVAYITGFTTGNAVGLWIDRRFGPGMQTISLISRERGTELAEGLRAANLRVTRLIGSGRDGAVHVAMLVVPRRMTPNVLSLARNIDPSVVVTVEDVQHANVEDPGRAAFVGKAPGTPLRGFPWRSRRAQLHTPALSPAPETAA